MNPPVNFAPDAPVRNIDELNAAHDALLDKLGDSDDPRPLADEMATLMRRAEATGRVLYHDSERTAAQSILNYWSAILYRAGVTPPSGDLEKFNPDAGDHEYFSVPEAYS